MSNHPFPSLSGQFLVAMPHMEDPRFRGAVILVLDHREAGALGVVINDPVENFSFYDLLKELNIDHNHKIPDHSLLRGGPVKPVRGFVLHRAAEQHPHSEQINEDFAWSFSVDILRDIVAGRGPSLYRLALGSAGWEEGQLESEIGENDWLVAPASPDLVFSDNPEQVWHQVFMRLGIEPSQMMERTGDA